MLTRLRRHTLHPSLKAGLGALVVSLALLGAGSVARADDDDATAGIARLNKQALDAFDGLNFDQAKTLLEQALTQGESADLAKDPAIARTHLNLGMLLIAGFQKRDEAIDHFKAALTIQPDITAPAGQFNPEVQSAFDEAKEKVEADQSAAKEAAATKEKARKAAAAAAAEKKGEEEEETEETPAASGQGFFLSLGLGSGLGIAKGHLDANKDIMQNGMLDNSWSGGLAPSRLGQIELGVGYFVSSDLMLSVNGRIQIVNGTTKVIDTPSCNPSCSPPSTGIAVMAKGAYFLSPGPLRPYVSAGLGGGVIRQVVKLKLPADQPVTNCGDSGMSDCVDTVTGGPFLMAAGGGIFYELGSVALIGDVTANVGVSKFMLNFDFTVGVGLHL